MIQDMLIHGTNGREVKVYYKGQRGEGIYDVAFEGLIKNVERQLPGDRLGHNEAGIREHLCVSHRVKACERAASEEVCTGSHGSR